MPLRVRRGTNAERITITPLEGELIFTTDTKKLYVGDNSTLGGIQVGGASDILSGDIVLNGHDISGTGNISVSGTIANGMLTLSQNSILSSEGYIAPASGHPIGILELGDNTHLLQLKRVWGESIEPIEKQYGLTDGNFSLLTSKYSSRGTLASPTVVQTGDALAYERVYGYDGFDYVVSSAIWQGVDPHGTPSPGHVPGSIAFITEGINGQNIVGINSRGFLSINKFPAAALEALDVSGNGLFSGTVTAGAFVGDVYTDHSTKVIDHHTGDVNANVLTAASFSSTSLGNGTLSFVNNQIFSTNTFVSGLSGNTIQVLQLGDNTNPLQTKINWKDSLEPVFLQTGITAGYSSLPISYRSSRGTLNSPAALQSGDCITLQTNYGFDGSAYQLSSLISCNVDPGETVNPGIVPGAINFITINSTGNPNVATTIDSQGYLGVKSGTLPIETPLDVFGDGTIRGKLIVKQYQSGKDVLSCYGITDGIGATSISNYTSRGTITSPTVLQSGDTLCSNAYYGYDGTDYSLSSLILFQQDQTQSISTGKVPGKISFFTVGTGGINPSSGFDANGNFGIKNAGLPIDEAFVCSGNGIIVGDGSNLVSALQLVGYNNRGGVGYHDFLSATNLHTNKTKFFRLDQFGSLQIIDNAYQHTLFNLTDDGHTIVKGYVQFGSFTTTERNALPKNNGMVIYNTTDNRFQGVQNGNWINLDNGSAA